MTANYLGGCYAIRCSQARSRESNREQFASRSDIQGIRRAWKCQRDVLSTNFSQPNRLSTITLGTKTTREMRFVAQVSHPRDECDEFWRCCHCSMKSIPLPAQPFQVRLQFRPMVGL